MKKVYSVILLVFACAFINAQTIKYKEVYSLIKDDKYDEALPQLNSFLKQEPKHSNANYWAGKLYYQKAVSIKSNAEADSSILFFNKAIENVTTMDLNPLNAPRFPDFTGETMVDKMESGKKFMQGKIDELSGLKKQWENALKAQKEQIKQDSISTAREAMQKKWASANTGTNDPMIVAKKWFEAFKNGDIETMFKMESKDEEGYQFPFGHNKTMEDYNSNKARYIEDFKKRIRQSYPDLRLTQDFNENDYNSYFEKDKKKPLVQTIYRDEKNVDIGKFTSFKYTNKTTGETSTSHFGISLIKINGKWLVVRIHN